MEAGKISPIFVSDDAVQFCLAHMANGERCGQVTPVKHGLHIAMILSHMAAGVEDPFALTDAEEAVLVCARTGDVRGEDRAEIYRRALRPENLYELRRMLKNATVKNELSTLLDEIKEEPK